MNNLKSEILFNRALIWLGIAMIRTTIEQNKWMALVYVAFGLYNGWLSYKAWKVEVE